MNSRQSWDDTRIQQARVLALRSLCARSKVGAIITGPEGRHIVGEGYNGPPRGYKHDSQPCTTWCRRAAQAERREVEAELSPVYDDCPALHAEANALMRSDHSQRTDGTIYVTSHVCFGCAKLVANSGLSRVVVDTDKADAHRNPIASYQFLLQCGIQVQLSDLVMQARLYPEVIAASGWVTLPPPAFPGGTQGMSPTIPAGYEGLIMTYDERVAQERAERQDPRR